MLQLESLVMKATLTPLEPPRTYIRLDGQHGRCKINASGHVTLMGFKTVDAALSCFRLARGKLKMRRTHHVLVAPHVVNMLWTSTVPLHETLEALAARRAEDITYVPERFAGAMIKLLLSTMHVVTATLFANGKLTLVGARSYEEAAVAREALVAMLAPV